MTGSIRTRIATLFMAALALGCSGDNDEPGGQFCSALASAPLCDASTCDDTVAAAQGQNPNCQAQLDAMLSCISGLSLSCTTSTSYQWVYADGDQAKQANVTLANSYELQIEDATCARAAEGFNSCLWCPDAPGAGTTTADVLGLGEVCTAGGSCAAGLTCEGVCVASCSTATDCPQTRMCESYSCFVGQCRAPCDGGGNCPPGLSCNGWDDVLQTPYCVP
jgi:hypothetical protein